MIALSKIFGIIFSIFFTEFPLYLNFHASLRTASFCLTTGVFVIKYLILISLFLASTVSALEHSLVRITNDEDTESFVFVIETDSENREILRFFKDLHDENGVRLEREVLSPELFQEASGLVLKEQEGRIVVRMLSENFESHNGGHVQIDTLYNGVTGSRRIYEYEVARSSDSWELLQDNQPIRSMHLRSKRLLALGTVGIADILNH
jgi:hypothetical protein